MTRLDQQLDSILADPLAAARAADGALGYVGLDIPADLLAASGRHTCHLPWDAGHKPARSADWLESSFAPWAFSVLDDWADGRFDFMEAVIFSRGDDNAQRLYYYVCELQRRGLIAGPTPLVFDIARIPRASSTDHTARAVRRVAAQLEIGADELHRGIAATNRRRAVFERLEAARTGQGDLYERICRASLFAEIEGLSDFTPPTDKARGRILLAGTMPPDGRLHQAVEQTGWTVAGEASDLSLLRLGPAVDAESHDPAAAIGRQIHDHFMGPRSFGDRGAWLLGAARRTRADAVILWLTEEEEAQVWHVPAQRRALASADIPALIMTRRQWDGADGAADEIRAFIEEVSA